jgi:hemolysin III
MPVRGPTAFEDRPVWRGRLHTWAFACSVPAGIALFAVAHGVTAKVAVSIYTLSLIALFGTSAAYHRLAHTAVAVRRLRRLDHSMIYVLIAGTYTPLCLLVLPRSWGIPLLIVAWSGAALGIVLKVAGMDRFPRLSNALYIVLGWTALLALPALVGRLPVSGFVLIAIGGVAYTAGAIMLLMRRPDPFPKVFGYHEMWHACTIIAAAVHFAAVWRIATA